MSPLTRREREIGKAMRRVDTEARLRRAGNWHGIACPKVPHTGAGYLHDAHDDTPYDVDGLLYCGRCHEALDYRPDWVWR